MATILGPVLMFRGNEANTWKVSVLLALDGNGKVGPLAWGPSKQLRNASSAAGVVIHKLNVRRMQGRVARYDFEVAQTDAPQQVYYRPPGGEVRSFVVPRAKAPPKIAYASCNGFSEPKAMKKVADKNRLWKDVMTKHATEPFHLLLLGGDQIYSDSMWTVVPELHEWSQLEWRDRMKADFQPMRDAVEAFYWSTYIERWSQPEVAATFGSVPTMMMWDDHDIFDGWGSYPDEQRECPVYQGIFGVATRYFRVFQLGIAEGEERPGNIAQQRYFSFGHRIGDVAVLAMDLRSERTEQRVMSDESWNAVAAWMAGVSQCKHLLLLSSIPVVHPDFGLVEKLLNMLPGQQELEDDLKDHWRSLGHRKERLRLIHRLFAFSAQAACRVTILSGDVHVAAVGVIESSRTDAPRNARVINQLTSSGIVHPPPPGMVLYFLESVGDKAETIDRDIVGEMAEFPATSHRFIGARNWLSLESDPENTLWANWWVEAEEQPYTKAIHPVA